MARKGKLLAALEAHQGRDIEAEKRKKQVKAAEKRKREKVERKAQEGDEDDSNIETNGVALVSEETFADFSDDDEEVNGQPEAASEIDREDAEEDEDKDESEDDTDSDVAFSELSATDAADTIPHQRLTINNGPALLSSQTRISLLRKQPNPTRTPFNIHNSLISVLPSSTTTIPDPNDDLTRELEFYRIARAAALDARNLLTKSHIPFSRPADYFAEMVKSDTHMDKIKRKLYNEAAEKKGQQEARRQRDAKKFGKQVQIAKLEERARGKREVLEKVKDLKRKRKSNPSDAVNEDPASDLFTSITVENAPAKSRSGRDRGPSDGPNRKRQKKNEKFGFGGKKRFAKSGDASSAGDMRGFSTSRMKEGGSGVRGGRGRGGGRGGGGGRGSKRLGKSRRAVGR